MPFRNDKHVKTHYDSCVGISKKECCNIKTYFALTVMKERAPIDGAKLLITTVFAPPISSFVIGTELTYSVVGSARHFDEPEERPEHVIHHKTVDSHKPLGSTLIVCKGCPLTF